MVVPVVSLEVGMRVRMVVMRRGFVRMFVRMLVGRVPLRIVARLFVIALVAVALRARSFLFFLAVLEVMLAIARFRALPAGCLRSSHCHSHKQE
jgi:hypothetical protein